MWFSDTFSKLKVSMPKKNIYCGNINYTSHPRQFVSIPFSNEPCILYLHRELSLWDFLDNCLYACSCYNTYFTKTSLQLIDGGLC